MSKRKALRATKKTFKCGKCEEYYLHEERALGNVCVYCLPKPEKKHDRQRV